MALVKREWIIEATKEALMALEVDVVAIGTSPAVLFEACLQAAEGKKTLILERDNVIGGAWRSVEWNGQKGLDNAPHFLSSEYDSRSLIENDLGIPVTNVPETKVVIDGRRFRSGAYKLQTYRLIQMSDAAREALKCACAGQWLNSRMSINNFKKYTKQLFKEFTRKKSFYYIENGSKALLDRILETSQRAGVRILYETQAHTITVSPKNHLYPVSIETNHEVILCKEVITTRRSHIKEFRIHESKEEKIFEFPVHKIDIHLAHLKFKGNVFLDNFYYRFEGNNIQFLTNLSYIQRDIAAQNFETILTLQYKQNGWMDIDATLANLSRLGVISPKAYLVDSRSDTYTKYHIDNHNIETIRKLAKGYINIIDARDLSRYFANNAARWRANSSFLQGRA